MGLTWIQKFQAIRSLSPSGISIAMRDRGDWYIQHRSIERKEGGCLSSGLTSGSSPEEATNQFWEWAIDPKYYMVVNAGSDRRHAVRWNGFMWEDVVEESS